MESQVSAMTTPRSDRSARHARAEEAAGDHPLTVDEADGPSTRRSRSRVQARALVLGDRQAVLGLTKAGFPATTFADVVTADADAVRGYFWGELAVIVVRNRAEVAAATQAGERLASLGIPSKTVDREDLP